MDGFVEGKLRNCNSNGEINGAAQVELFGYVNEASYKIKGVRVIELNVFGGAEGNKDITYNRN